MAVSAFAQNSDLIRSLNIADSLSMAKNYEKAEAAFSDIIKVKSDWAIPYAKRALVRVEMRKFTESRDDIVKAQDLDATNRLVVAAKKKYDEALEEATAPRAKAAAVPQKAADNDVSPSTARTQQAEARPRKADKFENPAENRNEEEAPRVTTRQHRSTANFPTTTPNRSLSRGQKIEQYSQLIRQNPNDDQAYAERGLQYGILGNDAAALQDYNTALQINPNNGNAYYLRGVYYATKSNRRSRAKGCADLQRAAALGMPKANAVLARECR